MRTWTHHKALVVLAFAAGTVLSCAKGLEAPAATPEVYILDGLVFDYGEEVPCYGAETINSQDHETRCLGGSSLQKQYPLVTVRLDPFAFDQHEVTNRQYLHCVELGDCEAPLYTDAWAQGGKYLYQYEDFPVQQVTRAMAETYCAFRGRRLPTDAEWQRVAQGSRALGVHRAFPAQEVDEMDDCQQPDINITGLACDGRQDFVAVTEPGHDFVHEGYTADLEPGKVHHLFSNVAEFTANFFQEDVTCKEPLPEGNVHPGGTDPDWDDCIPCDECDDMTGTALTNCGQECKQCEACAGTYQSGVAYRPDDYPIGPLDCHINCWGRPVETPVCVRYSPWDLPLEPSTVVGVGTLVTVRGGHAGLLADTTKECRFRSDYRKERLAQDATLSANNTGTDKGVGFRCARTLTAAELAIMATKPGFPHLAGGAPETLDPAQPIFSVTVDPGTSGNEDATGSSDPEADASESDEDAPGADASEEDSGPSES